MTTRDTPRASRAFDPARFAAIVKNEASGVVATMRSNQRWNSNAASSALNAYGLYGTTDAYDNGVHDVLLDAFIALRTAKPPALNAHDANGRAVDFTSDRSNSDASITTTADFAHTMTAVRYLEPFLDCVRSVETSGCITSRALSAILTIIKSECVSPDVPGGAGAAMHAVADSVTLCRFEATSVEDDDVVLSQILYVLAACVRCESGYALSDDDLCDVFQACYRIGHQSGKETSLLRELSKQTLSEIVYHVSQRLGEIVTGAAAKAAVVESVDEDAEGTSRRLVSPRDAVVIPTPPTPPPATTREDGEEVATESPHTAGPGVDITAHEHSEKTSEPYGLPALIEIFRFAVSLVAPDTHGRGSEDANSLFGLKLVSIMLDANGAYFRQNRALMKLVLDDLSRALCGVVASCSASVLAAATAIMTSMYADFREELKLHLEVFVRMVILPLCATRQGVEEETQRVALEALVELCKHEHFATDLYMYYDCDLTKPNVFEEVTSVLAQSSYPGDAELGPMHLLSLEGLLSIVQTVSDRTPSATPRRTFDFANASVVDPWSLANGANVTGPARFEALARIKYFKCRLLGAAEHFNRSYKKGLAFMQEIKLLPDPLEPRAVARFLKYAPALDKEVVGDYLGEPDEFTIAVLDEYVALFDFRDVSLDRALRSFLSGFKLPGEAQKISRILECFAARYYEANPDSVADADSAYVLSYSIIMLNTDQHNAQVKNKMTLEQFIRNNRGTNGGKDWPAEVLVNIFDSIVTDEIKLDDGGAASLTPSKWAAILRDVRRGDGALACPPDDAEAALYDGELFGLVWSASTAAITAVFEHTSDDRVVTSTLDGFLAVASVAHAHGASDALDRIVAALCAFATRGLHRELHSPSGERARPLVTFGEDVKARAATATVFNVARRFGDVLARGWCDVLDTILRMTKIGLVPENVIHATTTSSSSKRREIRTPRLRDALAAERARGSSLLRSFSAMLSGDDAPPPLPPPTESEKRVEDVALKCAESCRIGELFEDSKFLDATALTHLMRALVWAAGDPSLVAATPDDEDAALFCLDAMFAVTTRNRDRARRVTPALFNYCKAVIQASERPSRACEVVVFELIGACASMTASSSARVDEDEDEDDVVDDMVGALRLLLALHPQCADAYFGDIVRELDGLIETCAERVASPTSWDALCRLLSASARRPDAAETGFSALSKIMRDAKRVRASNARACLEAASAFVDSDVGGDERSVAALQLLSDANAALCAWASSATTTDEDEAEIIAGAWGDVVRELGRISHEDARAAVRDDAVLTLQRVLLGARELDAGGDLWLSTFDSVLLAALRKLAETVRKTRGRDGGAAENTARIAVSCVTKTLLQYASKMRDEDEDAFAGALLAVLDAAASLRAFAKTDELVDAVPEAIKNVLLVLSASDIVTRESETWDKMWTRAAAVDADLTPENLGLVVGDAEPELEPEPEPEPADVSASPATEIEIERRALTN